VVAAQHQTRKREALLTRQIVDVGDNCGGVMPV
jgi:hypothetical protein